MIERKVWKYELPFSGELKIQLPSGSRVLSVGNQGERLKLWMSVPQNTRSFYEYTFYMVMTGGVIPDACEFVGTVFFSGGAFIVHVFRRVA